MELPRGKWAANFSGVEGTLEIDVLRGQGDFGGKILRPDVPGGLMHIGGIWDDTAQKLSFAARTPGNTTVDDEWLEAFLIAPRNAAPGEDITYKLVGTIKVINVTLLPKYMSNYRRNTFGWFAELRVVS